MNEYEIFNPDRSIALSSSAGSGKTHTLTTRLITMLLKGVKQSEILAITFTNSAAGEIREKLFQRILLLEAGERSETELFTKILGMEGEKIRVRAGEVKSELIRQFTLLQISTIDSFFAKIIGCFPKETGVLDFVVIDDSIRESYIGESIEGVYQLLHEDEKLLNRVYNFIRSFREGRIASAPVLRAIYDEVHSKHYILESLSRAMEQCIDRVERDFFRERSHLFSSDFERKIGTLIDALTAHRNNLNRNLESLRRNLKAFQETKSIRSLAALSPFRQYRQKGMIGYLKKFFEGLPPERAAPIRSTFERIWADLSTYYMNEMDYFVYTWLDIYMLIQRIYDDLKHATHSIDFADIERRTLHFLRDLKDFALFHSRIESRIKYILIDEFQDTSELQWSALQSVVENALRRNGTLFYVGDIKQSIYRWRGGEPYLFDTVKEKLHIPEHQLRYNYRQNSLLLDFVNTVFGSIQQLTGGQYRYELQFLPPGKPKGQDGYVYIKRYNDREKLLTELIQHIDRLRQRGVQLQDIAVLCRKNSEIEEIEKLLRTHRVPFHSIGRTRLLKDSCISDIVNVIHFVLNPLEEMYLAGLLRAPFSRQSYEQLLDLQDRTQTITLNCIKDRNRSLYDKLRSLIDAAHYSTTSLFIRRVFEELDLFKSYPHKRQALIEFLELSYGFETTHEGLTLHDFAHFLEQNEDIIPLKVSEEHGITLQTIHASKGLEYHTVILPFLVQRAHFQLDGSLMYSREREGHIQSYALARRNYMDYHPDQESMSYIREETDLNYRIDELNTLYVAMTRTRENLLLFPLMMKGRETIGDLLLQAYDSNYEMTSFPYERQIGAPVESMGEERRAERVYMPISIKPMKKEHPVSVAEELPVLGDRRQRREGRLKGILFHTVLENTRMLPVEEYTVDLQIRVALAREAGEYTAREREAAARQAKEAVLNVIADERLAKYFTRSAQGELTVFSNRFQNLLGRIDRISIGEEVEVIDFKTNPIGSNVELQSLATHYRDQVDLYCAAIAEIYPEKRVRGFLYFTEADPNQRLVLVYEGR